MDLIFFLHVLQRGLTRARADWRLEHRTSIPPPLAPRPTAPPLSFHLHPSRSAPSHVPPAPRFVSFPNPTSRSPKCSAWEQAAGDVSWRQAPMGTPGAPPRRHPSSPCRTPLHLPPPALASACQPPRLFMPSDGDGRDPDASFGRLLLVRSPWSVLVPCSPLPRTLLV